MLVVWWYEPREVLPTLAVTHQVTLPTTKPEQFLLKASRSMEKRTGIYQKGTGTAFGQDRMNEPTLALVCMDNGMFYLCKEVLYC